MSVIFKIVYDDGAFYIGSSEGNMKFKKYDERKIVECSIIKTLPEGTSKTDRLIEHKKVMELYKGDEKLLRRYNPLRTEEETKEKINSYNKKYKEKQREYYQKNKDAYKERAKKRYEKFVFGNGILIDGDPNFQEGTYKNLPEDLLK